MAVGNFSAVSTEEGMHASSLHSLSCMSLFSADYCKDLLLSVHDS